MPGLGHSQSLKRPWKVRAEASLRDKYDDMWFRLREEVSADLARIDDAPLAAAEKEKMRERRIASAKQRELEMRNEAQAEWDRMVHDRYVFHVKKRETDMRAHEVEWEEREKNHLGPLVKRSHMLREAGVLSDDDCVLYNEKAWRRYCGLKDEPEIRSDSDSDSDRCWFPPTSIDPPSSSTPYTSSHDTGSASISRSGGRDRPKDRREMPAWVHAMRARAAAFPKNDHPSAKAYPMAEVPLAQPSYEPRPRSTGTCAGDIPSASTTNFDNGSYVHTLPIRPGPHSLASSRSESSDVDDGPPPYFQMPIGRSPRPSRSHSPRVITGADGGRAPAASSESPEDDGDPQPSTPMPGGYGWRQVITTSTATRTRSGNGRRPVESAQWRDRTRIQPRGSEPERSVSSMPEASARSHSRSQGSEQSTRDRRERPRRYGVDPVSRSSASLSSSRGYGTGVDAEAWDPQPRKVRRRAPAALQNDDWEASREHISDPSWAPEGQSRLSALPRSASAHTLSSSCGTLASRLRSMTSPIRRLGSKLAKAVFPESRLEPEPEPEHRAPRERVKVGPYRRAGTRYPSSTPRSSRDDSAGSTAQTSDRRRNASMRSVTDPSPTVRERAAAEDRLADVPSGGERGFGRPRAAALAQSGSSDVLSPLSIEFAPARSPSPPQARGSRPYTASETAVEPTSLESTGPIPELPPRYEEKWARMLNRMNAPASPPGKSGAHALHNSVQEMSQASERMNAFLRTFGGYSEPEPSFTLLPGLQFTSALERDTFTLAQEWRWKLLKARQAVSALREATRTGQYDEALRRRMSCRKVMEEEQTLRGRLEIEVAKCVEERQNRM